MLNRDLLDFGLLLLGHLQLEGQSEDAVLQLGHGFALDVFGQAKLTLEGAVRQFTDVILVVGLLAVALGRTRELQIARFSILSNLRANWTAADAEGWTSESVQL